MPKVRKNTLPGGRVGARRGAEDKPGMSRGSGGKGAGRRSHLPVANKPAAFMFNSILLTHVICGYILLKTLIIKSVFSTGFIQP